jgi:hypothetical protein
MSTKVLDAGACNSKQQCFEPLVFLLADLPKFKIRFRSAGLVLLLRRGTR